MADTYKFRLVVLGAGRVGKTSIISRLLYDTFPEKYVETVEDLHNRDYKFNSKNYQVNILDTAGELQFPAMRKLSITTAQGFILVYEVTEPNTLLQLKALIDEIIMERSSDFNAIPVVVVGNKIDQEIWHEIMKEDVEAYLKKKLLNWIVVEVSAKKNLNISDIFTALFKQWKGSEENKEDPDLKLHRTVSMKVWSDSSACSNAPSSDKNAKGSRGIAGYGRRLSSSFYRQKKPMGPVAPLPVMADDQADSEECKIM